MADHDRKFPASFTLANLCTDPLPKFLDGFANPQKDEFHLSPLLSLFKDALDVWKGSKPSHLDMPNQVVCCPGLVNDIYRQFETSCRKELNEPPKPFLYHFWSIRGTPFFASLLPECLSIDVFQSLIGNLAAHTCNQLYHQSVGSAYRPTHPLSLAMWDYKHGSVTYCADEELNLMAVELKPTYEPSIIVETFEWARRGIPLDYELNFEDSSDVTDCPQITLQKLMCSMISRKVSKALMMDSEFCCFASLVPFEDQPDRHFLALSDVFKLKTDEIPIFGTVVALILDQSSGFPFQAKWPHIPIPVAESTRSNIHSSESSLLIQETHLESFLTATTCLLDLAGFSSSVHSIKLNRVQPWIFPWTKTCDWPEKSNLSNNDVHYNLEAGCICTTLGEKVGDGRSGVVYRLQNTSAVAKMAIYNSYEEYPTQAIESVHIEAQLYETLLAPLQGRVVPRYGGLFSNHPSKIGNHRMMVLEDCGKALGPEEDFTSFDLETRLQVFRLICEIYDCGIYYSDCAPKNVCVGANGKDLRIIDFDACITFSGDTDQRANLVFECKVELLKHLEILDECFGEICQPSARQLDNVSSQVGILMDHQPIPSLKIQRQNGVGKSTTPAELDLKPRTRKRRFSLSS